MKKIILFLSVILFACNTPYSLNKFKPVLNISKLQAPYSKYNPLFSVKYGKFKDICHQFFNLQDNEYMIFYMCQEDVSSHRRSELRVKNEFSVSTKIPKILTAKLKILPLNQSREFTFLQIHTDHAINKPLLRVVWMRNYHNIYNHIWAVIKLGNKKNSPYKKIDLGRVPVDFFNIRIIIKQSKLNLFINSKKIINNFDVSYWNKFKNYFKAGVYLQGVGCAKVLFDDLKIN